MHYVIKVLGVNRWAPQGEQQRVEGQYVLAFDVEAGGGAGHLYVTPLRQWAMRFPDTVAALGLWKAQSKTLPLRPDGKPNRPMSAYTVELERVMEHDEQIH